MKKLGIFLLILLPLLIGLVVALPYVVTSDSMRVQFARQVSSASGFDIELNGPVHLSFFPTLGMIANDVGFSLPDGSLTATAAQLSSGVKFSTLFGNKIEITGIELKDPVVELVSSGGTDGAAADRQASPADGEETDLVKSAVAYLEGVSLNALKITNGRFITRVDGGARNEISEVNLGLVAPDLDGPIELDLSALAQGQKITATGNLAALRPILERRPVGVNFAITIDPPPHPAVADINLKGNVQLVQDAYQIEGGVLETLGQPLAMNVLYRPGERPYAFASLQADRVDLGILNPAASTSSLDSSNQGAQGRPDAGPDLAALRELDADINLKIGRLIVDGVEAADIDLAISLKDGLIGLDLANTTIANGQLALALNGDTNHASPVVKGTLSAKSLGIANLATLAGTTVPGDGLLNVNLGYAFQGLSESSIRKSLNVAGNINLEGVNAVVPQLAELGAGADKISNLNLNAAIENITKPVKLAGTFGWKGERITVNGQVNPRKFVTDGSGNVSAAVSSRRFAMEFNGRVASSGQAKGKAKLSTPSVDRLLAWIGQGGDVGVGPFVFAGNLDVSPQQVGFSKANIKVNGIAASGSGQATFKGKPFITTDLSFGELNLAALIGAQEGGSSGTQNASNPSSAANDAPLDLSGLRALDADIRLNAKKLGYGKVFAGPLTTTLRLRDGVARLDVPNANFYGGQVATRLTANGAANVPQIQFEANLQNVNALPLLRDAGEFERVEGVLNASISTSGSGSTTGQLRRSLNGNAQTQFRDGAIRGIDIAKIYNNLASVLAGGIKQDGSDRTEFTEMGLSMRIINGVAETDDLRLIGPLVRMDGAGSVDLGNETINMRLNPKLVASIKGQGGNFDVSGVSIPVIVEGRLEQPRIYPDLTGVLKNPQAALQSLAGIGLNVKGLKLDSVADKLSIENLAKEKLGLDKLGGQQGGGLKEVVGGLLNKDGEQQSGNGQVGDLIGGLLNRGQSPQSDDTSPAGSLVGSLLGNLGADSQGEAEPTAQVPATEAPSPSTGAIPIPQPNPRKRQAAVTAPQPAEVQQPKSLSEQIVDQVVPETDAQGQTDPARKTLNNLLKNVLENQ